MRKIFHVVLIGFTTFNTHATPVVTSNTKNISNGFIKNNGQFVDEHQLFRNDILFVFSSTSFKLILKNTGFSYELSATVGANSGNYESGYVSPALNDDQDLDEPQQHSLVTRIDVDFVNAQKNMSVEALDPATYYFNFYTQDKPVTHVPVFRKICYHDVYRGIDLVFYCQQEPGGQFTVKYDWIIGNGGNANDIALIYKGAKQMKIRDDGSLYLGGEIGFVAEGAPEVITESNAVGTPAYYKLVGNKLTFENVSVEKNKDVIIDPVISWGLYIGGDKKELPDEIVVDDSEHVYVTGRTLSQIFYVHSVEVASIDSNKHFDAFLSKFDASGNLLWCTYYGGPDDEKPFSMCLDPKTQEVFLGGKTCSATGIAFNCIDDPVNFKMDGTYGGNFDGFIAKFTTSGEVIRSTYVGGLSLDYILGITTYLDAAGNVYLFAAGSGEGATGIVVPSYTGVEQYTYSGGDKDHGDVILLKFNGDLSQRIWGTYYGSAGGQERGHELIVDNNGNLYVVGTMSQNFDGLAKGDKIYQSVKGGIGDAFLSRWTQDGKLTWLTFYGGPAYDRGRDVQTDRQGNIYIAGKTTAALSYPNAFASSPDVAKSTSQIDSDLDGYVAKFNSNGGLIWGSFFGGSGYDDIRTINVDPSGAPIYICGYTTSEDLPVTDDAYDKVRKGGDFYFAKLNFNATRILYCTYYGGKGNEGALPDKFPDWYNGIMDVSFPSGDIYISSATTSNCDIDPACLCSSGCTSGGYGDYDAFVAKFTDICGSNADAFEPNDDMNPDINQTPVLAYYTDAPFTVCGTLYPDGGDTVDYYQLPVPSNSFQITISLTQPAGNDYTLELVDANGVTLATGGNPDVISVTPANAGIYYVEVATSSSQSFTNVGCYSLKVEIGGTDWDGDGYSIAQNDCDDTNSAVHPNATETCNGIDDNCNGIIDEAIQLYKFTDNIYGAPLSASANESVSSLIPVNNAKPASSSCSTGFSSKNFTTATAFNTSLPAVEFTITPNPGYHVEATSFSADLRRSLSGPASVRFAYSKDGGISWTDEGMDHALINSVCAATSTINWDFADFLCTQPLKFRIYGFNASAPTGIFQLLNVIFNGKVCTAVLDADYDGYDAAVDCDESNPSIHPNAAEVCNGIDDNCNVQIDEGVQTAFYADADLDGYGNPNVSTLACVAPAGYLSNNTDCNDTNGAIHPNTGETCNSIDDNCDGTVDEATAIYNFTNNTAGIPFSVDANATATNLVQVNNANAGVSSCKIGFSSENFSNAMVYSPSLPAVQFTITPNAGYTLESSSFSAECRRNPSGPAQLRFAYSLDGGSSWIDEGVNHSLANAACGTMTAATWGLPYFKTTHPLIFRIYGFNASASSGTFQLMNVKFNGMICPSGTTRDETSHMNPGQILDDFELYPNPNDGHFKIDFQKNGLEDSEAALEIMNAIGQTIYAESIPFTNGEIRKELSLPATLAGGMYVLKLLVNGEVSVKEFFYQK